MQVLERQRLVDARRVVVKVGTAVVTREDGGVALGRLGALVEQLAALRREGREVLLVSSGAVGLGAERLGFTEKPRELVDRQACAAAGQGALIGLYSSFFERLGLRCAQVLLTEYDFRERSRYVNLAATLQRLLDLGAIPVINENDAVSADEIALRGGRVFGDNDRLSALVATGLQCDALVLLSDVDGVYSAPPGEPGARRLSAWDGAEVRYGALSARGRGGMLAKVEAARMATRGGVGVVIASGFAPDTVSRVVRGEDVGTWFPPGARLPGLSQWLAFATVPQARLSVGAPARAKLCAGGALVSSEILAVDGNFRAGEVVSVAWEGEEFARGLVACDAGALDRSDRLVITDDALVLLLDPERGVGEER